MKSFAVFVLVAIAVVVVSADEIDDAIEETQSVFDSISNRISDDVASVGEYIESLIESAEERLSDLAEDHYIVAQDCQSVKDQIEAAGDSVSADLFTQFAQCQTDLGEIEAKLQEVTNEIINHSDD